MADNLHHMSGQPHQKRFDPTPLFKLYKNDYHYVYLIWNLDHFVRKHIIFLQYKTYQFCLADRISISYSIWSNACIQHLKLHDFKWSTRNRSIIYSVQWCLGDENIFYTSIQSSCVHSHGHTLHQKYHLIKKHPIQLYYRL